MPVPSKLRFSVIIPAYNVEQYLVPCLESVLTQSFQDFELILVDDGSTDRTGKICDTYRQKFTQVPIQVIHQPNAGLSAARNTGIARASGEYLIFLDGDDYLTPGALAAIQNGLEPRLDVLRYQAREVFADGEQIDYAETGFATTPGVKAFPKLARYHYTDNAWLYAYRREFFVGNHFRYAVGCIAEDFGLTPLILARAQTVKAIAEICYVYRQRTGSIMHDTAQTTRHLMDMQKQLQQILPQIAEISGTQPILHYLVVSFCTGAAALDYATFMQVYREARQSGMLSYIHPANFKALPRALALRHFPSLFYRLYHY